MPRIPLFSASTGLNVVIAYVFALLLLYLIARLLLRAKLAGGKLLGRAGLTVLAVILLNGVGSLIGYHLPLNPVTILIPTILGLPGFALVALLQYLLF
jgi:inhibitor of the pro-sigma K processing machinery